MDDDDNEPDYGMGSGLPPPSALGLVPAPQLPRMSNLLLREAGILLEKHEDNSDRLAVILAHAACDVQMEDTLAQLFIARDVRSLYEPLKGLVGNQINLHTERVRAVYTALSGDDPAKQPWWSAWKEGIRRRNGVAHGGHAVNSEAAAKSLDACRKCVSHLQGVTASLTPRSWVSAKRDG